jgi:ABC-type sugar transport system ATPase subunit
MSLLSLAGLSKSYGSVIALRNASLAVEAGEVHALMGENGAGKSTLIMILAGVVQADRGAITLEGRLVSIGSAREAHRLGLRFLHQELNVLPRLSVAENLFLGRPYPRRSSGLINWEVLRNRSREVLETLGFADIDPWTILGRLSVGDRMIVKIASTLIEDAHARARVFVMDEPTAALASEESERLFRVIAQLQGPGAGIIFVSHRIEEVLRIAGRITVLRDGVSQPPIAAAHTSRADFIERMTGLRGVAPTSRPDAKASASVALRADRISDAGLRGVSFEVREGEVFGLAGVGNSGCHRLLRTLLGGARRGLVLVAGEAIPPRGPASGWRRGVAYVPGERRTEGLLLAQDVANNVALPHLGRLRRFGVFVDRPAERAAAARIGRRVRLRSTGPRERVRRLSGGNQQKVMFARAVAAAPRVLLLDEPTRGVDIAAKFDIHAVLRELAASGVAIVLASSDLEELLALSDRIGVMIDSQLVRTVPARSQTPASLLELCYDNDRP